MIERSEETFQNGLEERGCNLQSLQRDYVVQKRLLKYVQKLFFSSINHLNLSGVQKTVLRDVEMFQRLENALASKSLQCESGNRENAPNWVEDNQESSCPQGVLKDKKTPIKKKDGEEESVYADVEFQRVLMSHFRPFLEKTVVVVDRVKRTRRSKVGRSCLPIKRSTCGNDSKVTQNSNSIFRRERVLSNIKSIKSGRRGRDKSLSKVDSRRNPFMQRRWRGPSVGSEQQSGSELTHTLSINSTSQALSINSSGNQSSSFQNSRSINSGSSGQGKAGVVKRVSMEERNLEVFYQGRGLLLTKIGSRLSIRKEDIDKYNKFLKLALRSVQINSDLQILPPDLSQLAPYSLQNRVDPQIMEQLLKNLAPNLIPGSSSSEVRKSRSHENFQCLKRSITQKGKEQVRNELSEMSQKTGGDHVANSGSRNSSCPLLDSDSNQRANLPSKKDFGAGRLDGECLDLQNEAYDPRQMNSQQKLDFFLKIGRLVKREIAFHASVLNRQNSKHSVTNNFNFQIDNNVLNRICVPSQDRRRRIKRNRTFSDRKAPRPMNSMKHRVLGTNPTLHNSLFEEEELRQQSRKQLQKNFHFGAGSMDSRSEMEVMGPNKENFSVNSKKAGSQKSVFQIHRQSQRILQHQARPPSLDSEDLAQAISPPNHVYQKDMFHKNMNSGRRGGHSGLGKEHRNVHSRKGSFGNSNIVNFDHVSDLRSLVSDSDANERRNGSISGVSNALSINSENTLNSESPYSENGLSINSSCESSNQNDLSINSEGEEHSIFSDESEPLDQQNKGKKQRLNQNKENMSVSRKPLSDFDESPVRHRDYEFNNPPSRQLSNFEHEIRRENQGKIQVGNTKNGNKEDGNEMNRNGDAEESSVDFNLSQSFLGSNLQSHPTESRYGFEEEIDWRIRSVARSVRESSGHISGNKNRPPHFQ